MATSDAAAWVSAIGGLLAVGVSVYLHWQTVRLQKDRDRLHSRSAAMHVLSDFREAASQLSFVVRHLRDGNSQNEIPSGYGPETVSLGYLRPYLNKALEHMGVLPTLGAAAKITQAATGDLLELVRHLDSYSDPEAPDEWRYVGPQWPLTEQHLSLCEGRVAAAIEALEAEARWS